MSDPTPPSDTEALMGEWLWDAWLRAGAYRDTGSRREAIESMTQAVHEFLTSDWLAAERAVQRAESVTEARGDERLLLEYADSLPDWRDFSKREIRAWLAERADRIGGAR